MSTQVQQLSMKKDFLHYAVPSVIGMVVSSLYNIVDGIFVGRGVGEYALGAVNIVFPFIMLQIALTMLITIGGANRFSASKGRGDLEDANNAFLQSTYFLMMISVMLNVIVLLFPAKIGMLLGANDILLPYVVDYIWWVALFGIVYMPGLGISIFVRNDNAPQLEMKGTLLGAIVNIILDYLFVMVFHMGIAGAAIATGLGQMLSIAIYMTHFLNPARVLEFKKVAMKAKEIGKMLLNGIPSFFMEFSQSAISFSFNIVLMAKIGAIGVSAYSVVMYICSIFNMVLIGVVQGAQPIMSFNYGKGENDNVRKIYKLGVTTNIGLSALFYIIIFIFGHKLASIFVPNNTEVLAMASEMMRYYFLAFVPVGISLMNILYFQITQQEIQSIIISILRCFGFVQLFLFTLPNFLGIFGVYIAFFCGELCNCLLSTGLYIKSQYGKKARLAHVKKVV